MLIDVECKLERTIAEEIEDDVLCLGIRRQQVHRLREHRFPDKERRIKLLDAFNYPRMVLFGSVEKSDERPGINDGGGHRGRSPQGGPDSSQGRALRTLRRPGRTSSSWRGWDSFAPDAGH